MKKKKTAKQTPYQKMMEECPILYCQKNLPCTETCMCWGIEAGEGWIKPLTKLSKTLEDLNNVWWPLHRVRIQADQVKEKYGTLHFYYTVVVDPTWFRYYVGKFIASIEDFIKKHVKFKFDRVVISPQKTETKEEVISFSEYKKAMLGPKVCNVKYEVRGTEIYKLTTYEHYADYVTVLSNHKFLYWLKTKLSNIRSKLAYGVERTLQIEQTIEHLQSKADEAIKTAETECYNVCEKCGKDISAPDSRCSSTGWIRYICEDCASKEGYNYEKNGQIWNSKKLVKTKAQLKEEDKERNRKYRDQKKKQKEETLIEIEMTRKLLEKNEQKLKESIKS